MYLSFQAGAKGRRRKVLRMSAVCENRVPGQRRSAVQTGRLHPWGEVGIHKVGTKGFGLPLF